MKELFIGKISKILDLDLYTVEVDIPGYNEALPAFPKRGEIDEPRVGDVVLLTELDPLYKSYYLWEKLKENTFIGIRARGKVMRMSEEEVSIGIFDPADESWYDKNDGEDPTPEPTSWIKIDKEGNMDINLETNRNVVIAGDHTGDITGNSSDKIGGDSSSEISGNWGVKVSGDGTIECSGNCTIKASGNISVEASGNADIKAGGSCKINAPQVQITGGQLTVNGTAAPSSGPFCAIPACIFSGAPHSSNMVSGT